MIPQNSFWVKLCHDDLGAKLGAELWEAEEGKDGDWTQQFLALPIGGQLCSPEAKSFCKSNPLDAEIDSNELR